MEKSIYQQICDYITDGILDESFSLQDEDTDGAPFKWAPGAMDGVAMYHMQHSGLDASQAKGMAKALKSAASGNYPEAEALFNVWTKENRAISVIDELQKYVIDHSARLDAGNACYGGNSLYPCDWNTSRDCMIRLFEKKDDPQYANTLGYIYYYGRCNGGVPEYDKAFHYFGIAAANGLYEGMYKLADMYRHGYGCSKSMRTARNLYGMVYEDSLKHFLKGKNASFADAALRMGNVYAKGIDEEPDPTVAWYYYVQADYAAKIRAKDSDFFGNTTVVINIQKALEEMQEQLPEDYLQEHMEYPVPCCQQPLHRRR